MWICAQRSAHKLNHHPAASSRTFKHVRWANCVWSLTLLRMISGARYSGVPHNVQVLPFTLLAKPKSVTWDKKQHNRYKKNKYIKLTMQDYNSAGWLNYHRFDRHKCYCHRQKRTKSKPTELHTGPVRTVVFWKLFNQVTTQSLPLESTFQTGRSVLV